MNDIKSKQRKGAFIMKTDIKQIIEEYLKIFPNEKEKLNKLKSLIDNN